MSTPVVVVQLARMPPFNHALFGNSVIGVVPNVTRLFLNPQIKEVFSFLECLASNGIDLFSPLNYVSRGTIDPELVDEFILSHRRKLVRELCLDAKVGSYVVLASIVGVSGNDEWEKFISSCRTKANQLDPFGYIYSPYKLLPRYNVKAEVSDGVESTSLLLNDYDVLKTLNKLASKPPRSDELVDVFQCMKGQKFLFIVQKPCSHPAAQDRCFKAIRFTAHPEILWIFVERDYYLLRIMEKAMIVTALKKFAPLDDSYFYSGNSICTVPAFFRNVLRKSEVGESSSSRVNAEIAD